ncbi:hypothetical protein [Nitrosovibrio tenuis]|nr:hypothetical protein [Nitrosovibrio tenuis]
MVKNKAVIEAYRKESGKIDFGHIQRAIMSGSADHLIGLHEETVRSSQKEKNAAYKERHGFGQPKKALAGNPEEQKKSEEWERRRAERDAAKDKELESFGQPKTEDQPKSTEGQSRGMPKRGIIEADDPSIYGSELLGWEGRRYEDFHSTLEAMKRTPKFSRTPNKEDVAFAHDFLVELADVDELFRHAISHKTSLKGVFSEVYPDAVYVGDGTREDERDESGADHRYVFKLPNGKQFYVYERDNGEVFIDVSHFSTGERGQAVYAAVANWAYNTKRKFIGDPAGLTADSLIRRTSNMLSSALRFGTVKHLEAAPQQIAGDPKNGVPPLDWSGDDVAKTRALIHTFIETLHNKFPEITSYRYDFANRQFTDRLGRPVGLDRFTHAEATGLGGSARAGKASMRRGILIQSLISSEGSERPGILEQVLNRSSALVLRGKLEGIFSRKAESERISAIRQRLKAAAFKKTQATHSGGLVVSGEHKSAVQTIVDAISSAWKNAPEMVVVSDMNDSAVPDAVRETNSQQMSQGAVGQPEGFFYDGKVYIVASEMRSPEGHCSCGVP